MGTKTWGRTETGMVFHSFKADGTAICRSNIKAAGEFRTEASVNAALAKPWGLATQGFRKCENCAAKAAFRDRAEASMTPSTGESDHLPPADIETSTAITPDTEETPMGLEARRTTGPLTPRQTDIIELLAGGLRQKEAAAVMGVARSYISSELSIVTAKLSAGTGSEAVAIYTRAKVWREVAGRLRGCVIPEPLGEAEVHLNRVFWDLADEFDRAADGALPR